MPFITRGFAAAVLAAAITAMTALPVSARQPVAPRVAVFLPNLLVGAESSGTLANALVGASESVVLQNFVFKVEFAGLDGVATVTPDPSAGCDVTASAITCRRGAVTIDEGGQLNFVLAVAPPFIAIIGATGKWKATVSADGIDTISMESSVTLAEGVDLGVPTENVSVTGSPGSPVPVALQVNNVGEKAGQGAVALISNDYPVVAGKQYSNCTFREGKMTSCGFDERLEPGTAYTTEEVPFKLRADTFAPGRTSTRIQWMTKAEFDLLVRTFEPGFLGSPGTGDRLRLQPRPSPQAGAPQTDIDQTNNIQSVNVKVDGDNGADLAAVGGTSHGRTGEVVTLDLGLHNAGPATIDFTRSDEPAGVFDVTLPPGSSLAEMPQRCVAMRLVDNHPQTDPDRGNLLARIIRCDNRSRILTVGSDWTVPVKLRIDQVIAGAAGSVTVPVDCAYACRPDANPANDTAAVVLNSALPATGVQTGLIAGSGVLLTLAGLAAFVLGRRRRFRFTQSN